MNRRSETPWLMILCVSVVLALSSHAVAQGFVGTARAIEDDVPIRAGGGSIFYIVGQLQKGDLVKIDDETYGWYKIVPPPGVYSYIRKQNVDVAEDGKVGTINTDRVPVRAADIDGPGGSYRRQLYLFKGDTIRLGDPRPQGAYYKIVPPKGCYVFVRGSAVKRVDSDGVIEPLADDTAEAIDPNVEPKPEVVEPAPVVVAPEPEVVEPEPVVVEPEPEVVEPELVVVAPEPEIVEPELVVVVPEPEVVEPELVLVAPEPEVVEPVAPEPDAGEVQIILPDLLTTAEGFESLEQCFNDVSQMPLERQPVDALLSAYRTMAESDDLTRLQRRMIRLRIRKLQSNAELATMLRRVSEAQQAIGSPVTPASEPEPGVASVEYDVKGVLLASSVYNGVNLPRLYRLVSPTSKTIAYIRPTQGIGAALVGRTVGAVGESSYDPALKVQVLEAERVEAVPGE